MKTKIILLSSLAAVVGIVVASRMLPRSVTTREAAAANPGRVSAPEPAKPPPAPASQLSPPEPSGNLANRVRPQEAKLDEARKAAPPPAPATQPKEPLRDPAARAAMSRVGLDPEAEAYWLEAIFDSSLPEQEREDLIEDLNEEGLSDHRHPGPQDFSLILNRIAIIENIVPQADEFMLPHLAEAYKDLVNLAAITQGGGEPVQ